MLEGHQLDGTYRMHLDGASVAQAGLVSGFAQYSVMPGFSCIPVGPDIPLELASLLGCAVPTGWGSAVNAASARPGDVVVVIGAGGIGIAAVQGANHAGASRIVVVEPMVSRHELCAQSRPPVHSSGLSMSATPSARSARQGRWSSRPRLPDT